jgi:hypothetical protein
VQHSEGGVSNVKAAFLMSWWKGSSVYLSDDGLVCWLAEGKLLGACVSIMEEDMRKRVVGWVVG